MTLSLRCSIPLSLGIAVCLSLSVSLARENVPGSICTRDRGGDKEKEPARYAMLKLRWGGKGVPGSADRWG